MIAKSGHLKPEVITAAPNKTCQNTHAVPKLIRITRFMNIRLNAGAVRTHGSALFDFFLFGITQNITIDHFPGLIADGFNITVQSRFLKSLFSKSDATKPTQAMGVDDVKSQILISALFFMGYSEL